MMEKEENWKKKEEERMDGEIRGRGRIGKKSWWKMIRGITIKRREEGRAGEGIKEWEYKGRKNEEEYIENAAWSKRRRSRKSGGEGEGDGE